MTSAIEEQFWDIVYERDWQKLLALNPQTGNYRFGFTIDNNYHVGLRGVRIMRPLNITVGHLEELRDFSFSISPSPRGRDQPSRMRKLSPKGLVPLKGRLKEKCTSLGRETTTNVPIRRHIQMRNFWRFALCAGLAWTGMSKLTADSWFITDWAAVPDMWKIAVAASAVMLNGGLSNIPVVGAFFDARSTEEKAVTRRGPIVKPAIYRAMTILTPLTAVGTAGGTAWAASNPEGWTQLTTTGVVGGWALVISEIVSLVVMYSNDWGNRKSSA